MYNRRNELYDVYMEEETKENKEAYNQICNDYDEVEMNTVLQGRLWDVAIQATNNDI